jgi:hypothetical protein
MAKPLSTRAMGRELGISGPVVVRYKKRGMPMDDPAKAREWRALYVRPLTGPPRPQLSSSSFASSSSQRQTETATSNVVDLYATEVGAEQLEDTIPRLRRLEKATSVALERAIKEDNLTASVALRREHCTALKTLYNAEEKLIRINVSRGKLIAVSEALSMINNSLQSGITVLRRLPELGRTPEERTRLAAFLNSVLNEFRAGAATSVHSGDGEAAKV